MTARRQASRSRRRFDAATELTVTTAEPLNDVMTRMRFAVATPELFDLGELTDTYVKLVFAGGVRRTYTVRRVDPATREITIDFVTHGTRGTAGPWAAQATTGQVIGATGVGGGYRPSDEADWHLFAGDESALPAIARALDDLPAGAAGVAVLETADRQHRLPAAPPPGIDIVWLDRLHAGTTPTLLADHCAPLLSRPGRLDVFAHGERESIKRLRTELRRRSDATVSVSGYWALGASEDTFRADR